MAHPHPTELRQRVDGFVEQGHSHRETARIFQVSVRFVNNMVLLTRERQKCRALWIC